MSISLLLIVILVLAGFAYFMGQTRSYSLSEPLGGVKHLNSLPFYYGMNTAFWCGLPALGLLVVWLLIEASIIDYWILANLPEGTVSLENEGQKSLLLNTVHRVANGSQFGTTDPVLLALGEQLRSHRQSTRLAMTILCISLAILGAFWGWRKVAPEAHARIAVEKVFNLFLLTCSVIAILTTVGIVLSVLHESIRFFNMVNIFDFLFGLHWSPQSGTFGSIPLFAGTLMISFIAMVVAVPVGLMSAIYLSEYANQTVRSIAKPLLEILAGVPTVVYGFFAALTVAPWLRDNIAMLNQWLNQLGLNITFTASSESALAAGVVMGIMIIPFVSSLSDDVINAVPQAMRDGSYGLGATRSETVKKVVFPAALPGIVGGILLAVSRAIGETMIVVMAAGLAANLTANPLESVTTVTVQIVTLLVGDQEFDSPKTLVAFALGLMLFIVTLLLNFLALHVVKKYREQYE